MTYSAITGEPIFSPRELLDFSLRAAELSNISAKEIFDDLCYLLGPHYWGYAYDFNAAMREVTPLDYPVYSAASLDGDLGDGEKILTAQHGRDTINTTEARQSREKGWHTMEIIINETGKRYNLTMQEWTGSDWGPDMAQDVIIDSSYHWDDTAEAWRMDGHEDNLTDYLHDWEQYNTDADRDAYDEDERARLRDERPRSYDLSEISK